MIKGEEQNGIVRISRKKSDKEIIEGLNRENADLWYELMLEKSRNDNHDSDISDLWYEIMMGGI